MNQLITLNRRELLKTTTGLVTGWVVAGSSLALIAPGAGVGRGSGGAYQF